MLWQPDSIEINATAANAQAYFLPILAPLFIKLFIAIPCHEYKSLERGDLFAVVGFPRHVSSLSPLTSWI
jgi:hypothetical protein